MVEHRSTHISAVRSCFAVGRSIRVTVGKVTKEQKQGHEQGEQKKQGPGYAYPGKNV